MAAWGGQRPRPKSELKLDAWRMWMYTNFCTNQQAEAMHEECPISARIPAWTGAVNFGLS